jgi:hypothetical protein
MNDKTNHRDGNAGISDIERRPGMSERNMQIEEKKIDDVSVEKAIGKIPQDAGEQQGERNIAPNVHRPPTNQQQHDKEEGKARDHHKKCIVVLEGAKSRARVRDVNQIEEPGDDSAVLIGFDEPKHTRLRQLIERVERQ